MHRNTFNPMPQTEVVTHGFILRRDPNSAQPCLCLATESQLGASPAPGIIWGSFKAVMNYKLPLNLFLHLFLRIEKNGLNTGFFTPAISPGHVSLVMAVPDRHCRGRYREPVLRVTPFAALEDQKVSLIERKIQSPGCPGLIQQKLSPKAPSMS